MQQELYISKEASGFLNKTTDVSRSDIQYLINKILSLNENIDIKISVDLYTDPEEGWSKIKIDVETKEEVKSFDQHMKDQDLLFEEGCTDEKLIKIFPHVIVSNL